MFQIFSSGRLRLVAHKPRQNLRGELKPLLAAAVPSGLREHGLQVRAQVRPKACRGMPLLAPLGHPVGHVLRQMPAHHRKALTGVGLSRIIPSGKHRPGTRNEPRVAARGAPDHDARGPRLPGHGQRRRRRVDVAVGNHRNRHCAHHRGNVGAVDAPREALRARAAVNRDGRRPGLLGKQGEAHRVFRGLVPPRAHLDGHGHARALERVRHGAHDLPGKGRLAHQGRAAGLSADHACRTAEVDVHDFRAERHGGGRGARHLRRVGAEQLHGGKRIIRVARHAPPRHLACGQMRTA